ncbi:MAG: Rieske (2Fe-2S) protein [Methylovulum sp.]|jgi:3-phenylpropionate/trans-cinnamate dioxygenase ferredoxin subunit
MTEWINVAPETSLAKGEHLLITLNESSVAVFNIEGKFYSIEDMCSHDGTEIASGIIKGEEIICPRHGARFCLKTGAVKCAPAYEAIAAFPTRVVDGWIQIQDHR